MAEQRRLSKLKFNFRKINFSALKVKNEMTRNNFPFFCRVRLLNYVQMERSERKDVKGKFKGRMIILSIIAIKK